MKERYLMVEAPDNKAVIDFLGGGGDKYRACSVRLTVENGKLHIYATGCDDRTTILIDTEVPIPEEDDRS